MMMTFDDEYNELMDLIKFKKYRRYGDNLYAQYVFDDGFEWKLEYNICELVWGFCKNPCYANRLVEALGTKTPDMNKCVKTLAKSNKNIRSDRTYNSWEAAINAVELNDNSKHPFIVYSTESTHLWTDKKVFCNDVDGELWHGILMTKDALDNLDRICVELSGTNSREKRWNMEYMWHSSDVKTLITHIDDNVFFSPFKHPLILIDSGLEVAVSFHFTDGRLPKESQVKMVYGLCNSVLRHWIENPTSTFTTELAHGRKLVIDTTRERVDEMSTTIKC